MLPTTMAHRLHCRYSLLLISHIFLLFCDIVIIYVSVAVVIVAHKMRSNMDRAIFVSRSYHDSHTTTPHTHTDSTIRISEITCSFLNHINSKRLRYFKWIWFLSHSEQSQIGQQQAHKSTSYFFLQIAGKY